MAAHVQHERPLFLVALAAKVAKVLVLGGRRFLGYTGVFDVVVFGQVARNYVHRARAFRANIAGIPKIDIEFQQKIFLNSINDYDR